jgi:urea transport system substrate-binding protein
MNHFTINYGRISLLILGLVAIIMGWFFLNQKTVSPIRIGVLHSLTGTMAISEQPLVDAVRLAVNEINAQGGIVNRPIEMVIADGQSDPSVFAKEAERLITQEKVSVIFGCWTSASRKAVKPIIEKHNHLLFYPMQYEGLEQSSNIIYTGAAPNQQIIPATRWALTNLGKRVYLIGSDYIFPRTANQIMKDFIRVTDGTLLAERYLPLGSHDVEAIVNEIEQFKPDVILNTINGDSNAYFFKALANGSAKDTPVLSFSVAENEVKNYPPLSNHYAAWSYFQSLDNPTNQQFIANYQALVGDKTRVTSDSVEAAYFGVHLWAQAAKEIKSVEPEKVNEAVLKQSFHAPSGIISIDVKTRHTWKMLRIGQAQPNGQFKEIYNSTFPIRPEPFPSYRPKSEWAKIAASVNNGEGKK